VGTAETPIPGTKTPKVFLRSLNIIGPPSHPVSRAKFGKGGPGGGVGGRKKRRYVALQDPAPGDTLLEELPGMGSGWNDTVKEENPRPGRDWEGA
jgi:hypothetical protein